MIINLLVKLLFVFLVLSWVYWVIAYELAYAFFKRPLLPDDSFTPPVSILKPVKGLDPQVYENFSSFCRQDYPDYEILFGVADRSDPVIPVIRRLQHDCPQRRIRLIVQETLMPNHKVGLLDTLSAAAGAELLVISDSDMRVTPDYLRRVVAPLQDPKVGLVTCPYRGIEPVTFTARLEALHMGVIFLPSVLVGRIVLRMRFALGSTEALRRRDLERIGGFAGIGDYLADDYQLGRRISQAGLRVHLSDYVITSVLGATTFKEQWDRELRWALCTRISRPLEYPGYALSFTIPLAVLLLLASGLAPWAWSLLLFSLILRIAIAWAITYLTGDGVSRRWLFWLPVRDMLHLLVWLGGLIGNHVVWRGEVFVLNAEGRLIPAALEEAGSEELHG